MRPTVLIRKGSENWIFSKNNPIFLKNSRSWLISYPSMIYCEYLNYLYSFFVRPQLMFFIRIIIRISFREISRIKKIYLIPFYSWKRGTTVYCKSFFKKKSKWETIIGILSIGNEKIREKYSWTRCHLYYPLQNSIKSTWKTLDN